MRTSLNKFGWLDVTKSASQLLPNLAVVPTHYPRLFTSISNAGTELRQLCTEIEPLRSTGREVATLRSEAPDLRHSRTALETRCTEAERRLMER